MARGIAVRPIEQPEGACGNTTLLMVCRALGCKGLPAATGRAITRLGELAGTTEAEGTDHAGMITGAARTGATVYAKADGSIDELRWFVNHEHLPVIYGWWSLEPQ